MKGSVSINKVITIGIALLVVALMIGLATDSFAELKRNWNDTFENPIPTYEDRFEIAQAYNPAAFNLFESLNHIPKTDDDACYMQLIGFGDFFRNYDLNLITVNDKLRVRLTDYAGNPVSIKSLDAAKKYCVVQDYSGADSDFRIGNDIRITKKDITLGSDLYVVYVDGELYDWESTAGGPPFEDIMYLYADKEKTCIAYGNTNTLTKLNKCQVYNQEQSQERFVADVNQCLLAKGEDCYCTISVLDYPLNNIEMRNYESGSKVVFKGATESALEHSFDVLWDYGGFEVQTLNVGGDGSSQIVIYENINSFPHTLRLTHQASEGLNINAIFSRTDYDNQDTFPPQRILVKKPSKPEPDSQRLDTFMLREKKYPRYDWEYLEIIKDKKEANGACG